MVFIHTSNLLWNEPRKKKFVPATLKWKLYYKTTKELVLNVRVVPKEKSLRSPVLTTHTTVVRHGRVDVAALMEKPKN